MKRNVKYVDGRIVVKNPLAQQLPDMTVTLQSGKTTYRFSGKYDGKHSVPSKVLRLIEKDDEKDADI